MKILLVEPDESRGQRLCTALQARGVVIRHTVDAFYALTLAERTEIDMVFVSARVQTIGVGEFVQILTEDPALSKIKVAVYSTDALPAGFSLPPLTEVLAATTDVEVAKAIMSRLGGQAGVAAKAEAPKKRRGVAMIGVFEMTTLPGLLQMVCSADDQGTIQVKTPSGIGVISYSPGLVHVVEYLELEGVPAMAKLMTDVETNPSSQFRVAKSETNKQESIGVRPAELLLEVAVLHDNLNRATRCAGGNAS